MYSGESGPGSGLGMDNISSRVHEMNGEIDIHLVLNEPVAFHIKLPIL
jgi:chemotaxis protein histidine kinase CheA